MLYRYSDCTSRLCFSFYRGAHIHARVYIAKHTLSKKRVYGRHESSFFLTTVRRAFAFNWYLSPWQNSSLWMTQKPCETRVGLYVVRPHRHRRRSLFLSLSLCPCSSSRQAGEKDEKKKKKKMRARTIRSSDRWLSRGDSWNIRERERERCCRETPKLYGIKDSEARNFNCASRHDDLSCAP